LCDSRVLVNSHGSLLTPEGRFFGNGFLRQDIHGRRWWASHVLGWQTMPATALTSTNINRI